MADMISRNLCGFVVFQGGDKDVGIVVKKREP